MRFIAASITALAIGLGVSAPASAQPIPDDWYMDDGIGVGLRVAGTPCLKSELHQFADSTTDGSGYALWCAPPSFVWVSVK